VNKQLCDGNPMLEFKFTKADLQQAMLNYIEMQEGKSFKGEVGTWFADELNFADIEDDDIVADLHFTQTIKFKGA
jgi:hypothetical protein